jgi:hypothetical protein
MWHFLNTNASAIQSIAATATLIVTAILAGITLRYAKTAANTLALNRKQFDREWEPRIHVQTTRIGTATIAETVTNLGRAAIVLTGLEMKIDNADRVVELDHVLRAGEGSEFDWTSQIVRAFNLHGFGPGNFSFNGDIGLRIRFESLGKIFYSNWQTKKTKVTSGTFESFR